MYHCSKTSANPCLCMAASDGTNPTPFPDTSNKITLQVLLRCNSDVSFPILGYLNEKNFEFGRLGGGGRPPRPPLNTPMVTNSNFDRISYRFGDIELKARKWLIFSPLPCLTPPARGNPLEFLDETYLTKTRGRGIPYGKNFIILTSTVFDWSTRVTDGQTVGRAIAYSALSICYAVAR